MSRGFAENSGDLLALGASEEDSTDRRLAELAGLVVQQTLDPCFGEAVLPTPHHRTVGAGDRERLQAIVANRNRRQKPQGLFLYLLNLNEPEHRWVVEDRPLGSGQNYRCARWS
jgi:hypothetical protein